MSIYSEFLNITYAAAAERVKNGQRPKAEKS